MSVLWVVKNAKSQIFAMNANLNIFYIKKNNAKNV